MDVPSLLFDFPPLQHPARALVKRKMPCCLLDKQTRQIAAFMYLFIYLSAVHTKCNSALWFVFVALFFRLLSHMRQYCEEISHRSATHSSAESSSVGKL
jgi:hypothetical protein